MFIYKKKLQHSNIQILNIFDGNITINITLLLFSFIVFYFFWRDSPQWGRASSFTRFLDHTQRRTTVGRTPVDE